ncbi:hypothetical protein [Streptomyces sp. NPDC087437]|uniref:hypothetical protein n=1 Tax=Streptomyces sp. NPDC087437 TaxID=3365789 RepID=UPI003810145A
MRVNRTRLGLILLMLPTFLVALDTTALLLALPRLSADLGADNVEHLWILVSVGRHRGAGTASRRYLPGAGEEVLDGRRHGGVTEFAVVRLMQSLAADLLVQRSGWQSAPRPG